MQVVLAKPRGFCAGVDRAIEIVERALQIHGAPIYVRHEVVHNKFVVDDLARKARYSSRSLTKCPPAAPSFSVRTAFRRRSGARPKRAAQSVRCDLSARDQSARGGREKARAGPRDRDDRAPGTSRGRGDDGPGAMAACTSSRRLTTSASWRSGPGKSRVRHADHVVDRRCARRSSPRSSSGFRTSSGRRRDDICYATQNRQDAVKALAQQCDVVIVVGSPNSSNSNRLARSRGAIRECRRLHGRQCAVN